MKIKAIPVFLLARLYAKQTNLPYFTLRQQLNAISLFLNDAKIYLK